MGRALGLHPGKATSPLTAHRYTVKRSIFTHQKFYFDYVLNNFASTCTTFQTNKALYGPKRLKNQEKNLVSSLVQTCASVSVHNFDNFLQEYDTLTEPEIKALYYTQMLDFHELLWRVFIAQALQN